MVSLFCLHIPALAVSPTMSMNRMVTSACDRASWAMSRPLGMLAECDRNSITCLGKICASEQKAVAHIQSSD